MKRMQGMPKVFMQLKLVEGYEIFTPQLCTLANLLLNSAAFHSAHFVMKSSTNYLSRSIKSFSILRTAPSFKRLLYYIEI